jgi:hypothetical protein
MDVRRWTGLAFWAAAIVFFFSAVSLASCVPDDVRKLRGSGKPMDGNTGVIIVDPMTPPDTQ